jgi:hypothetical protein
MRGALTAALLKLDPALGQERISAFMREAFAAEYASERRLLQSLREVKAQAPEAVAEQEAHRDGATQVRRPMPASTVDTAQVQLAAPLGPPPRARTDDKTIPGVRLEDLEREAQDRTPTPEHAPAPVPSMLDEEILVGHTTGPHTAPGEPVVLAHEPEAASIEVSPELFEDEEAQSAAFRPTAKRYPEPDTGKHVLNLAASAGTDPNVNVGMTPRTGMITGPHPPVSDTPRAGIPTGPGAAWTGPVTSPVAAVRSGPSWGLWGGVAAAVVLLGGGAAFTLRKTPAPRVPPAREAPTPVRTERLPEAPVAPEPALPPAPPPTPTAPPTPPVPDVPDVPPAPRPAVEAPAPAPGKAPEPPAAPPRPLPAAPARPTVITPAPARPAVRSSGQAVDEAWAQLRDRMERLDTLCAGNARQAQKLRSRFTGLEPFYRNEERDNDDVLRRIRLLVDDVDGCALEAPR